MNGEDECEEDSALSFGTRVENAGCGESDLPSERVDDDEIKAFVNQITISEEEAGVVMEQIVSDLKNTFKDYFPYECLPFGSYVNGLRCKDSDLDICLRIAPLISAENQRPTLNKIKKYLYRNTDKAFSSIVTIPKAKVPIVKFRHVATFIDCDLSLDNEVGVQNTYLVKSYLSMNTNLNTFVVTLKYLLAQYYLRGSGKFTTFILFWLVVFFMQQLDLLPPVMNARESSIEQRAISGWNCSIPQPLTTPINDPFTLRHHLQKFFEFYSNYDYASFVICPYLACEIPVENFVQLRLPQHLFSAYLEKIENATAPPFPHHVINLQDPTSLNVNLTKPISPSVHHAFKTFCKTVHEFFIQNKSKNLIYLLNKINPKSLPLKYSPVRSVVLNKVKRKKRRKIEADPISRNLS